MEVFLTRKNQELVFLEIGARTGGALITRVYERLFDINIEQTNYMIQMGLINQVRICKKDIFAGFLNFPKIEGTVSAIEAPTLGIEHEFIKFVRPGDHLKQASNLLDISCSIIFWDTSYQKVKNAFEFLKNYEPLIMNKINSFFIHTASPQQPIHVPLHAEVHQLHTGVDFPKSL